MNNQIPQALALKDLIEEHARIHALLGDELAALDPEIFFRSQGKFWSPAFHLDHLSRSVRALVQGLRLPRLLLRLLFGAASSPRPNQEVVDFYLKSLGAGAGASGRYVPTQRIVEDRTAQELVIAEWQKAGRALGRRLGTWHDADLDRYRLPHPILGKLSVREMVAWSLYHAHHHRNRILERAAS